MGACWRGSEEGRRVERVVVPDGRTGRGRRRWAWRWRAPWELGSEPVDSGSEEGWGAEEEKMPKLPTGDN